MPVTWGTPWFSGPSSSSEVPSRFPVAIGGRPYLVDLIGYQRRTIAARRQPVDDGSEVGENSLNTEGLWSRSQSDWSLGAGQSYYDNSESERRRFSRSIGVDPWTRDCLTLLYDVDSKKTVSNDGPIVLAAGSRLYLSDGQSVYYTTDPTVDSPTWTTVTGTPAATVLSMATDGYDVYVAYGASDLYVIDGGGSSATTLGTTDTDVVAYTNGRLLAGHDNVVSEVDNAGTYTAEFTHPLTAWTVRGFTSSPANAYFWGDTGGGKSDIYRIGVQEDGSLAAAIYAGTLPVGETLNEMEYYAGLMLMATTAGVRVASIAADGTLVVGPAIPIDGGSSCVAAEGQFVWFGWTDPYSNGSTGLGRADLSRVTEQEGTPPYASDIQAGSSTAGVASVAVFEGKRYFATDSTAVYGEDTVRVSSGWLETGRIRFSTLERKVSATVELSHDSLPAGSSIDVSLMSSEDTAFVLIGSSDIALSVETDTPLSATEHDGEWQELKVTLNRATDTTASPAMRVVTLRSLPSPRRIREIILPLVIKQKVQLESRQQVSLDVLDEIRFIEALESTGRVVTYQEGSRTYQVYVDRSELANTREALELSWTDRRGAIEGILNVRLLTLPEG